VNLLLDSIFHWITDKISPSSGSGI